MSSKLLGNGIRGKAFIVSAPAGTGKTTLVQRLVEEFPEVTRSISCTTRKPRAGEIHGKDYLFLTESEFQSKIAAGDFLEYAELYGNYYGTCRTAVLEKLNAGKHVILTIDTQGALQLKKHFPAAFIFIKPPSVKELEQRLLNRKTETQAVIAERLQWMQREMEAASQYDYNLVNDDLDLAYQVLRSIVIAEDHRH